MLRNVYLMKMVENGEIRQWQTNYGVLNDVRRLEAHYYISISTIIILLYIQIFNTSKLVLKVYLFIEILWLNSSTSIPPPHVKSPRWWDSATTYTTYIYILTQFHLFFRTYCVKHFFNTKYWAF